jgi:hypothetical protein
MRECTAAAINLIALRVPPSTDRCAGADVPTCTTPTERDLRQPRTPATGPTDFRPGVAGQPPDRRIHIPHRGCQPVGAIETHSDASPLARFQSNSLSRSRSQPSVWMIVTIHDKLLVVPRTHA